MAFFEAEFPRTISYKAVGGPAFNTFLVDVASGAEQRNRNWAAARHRWTISLQTPSGVTRQAFADALNTFFLMIGGKADAFRFFDHLSYSAAGQAMALVETGPPLVLQLQRTYSLGGRSYVRTVTKPVTSAVIDYQGNALTDTVVIESSGGVLRDPASYDVDETTGQVTGHSGSLLDATDLATFQYHVPVRLDADDSQVQIEDSNIAGAGPIVSWNSLVLVEVRPPNY
jgi:uncharacterized protein (TIGR02217 family)